MTKKVLGKTYNGHDFEEHWYNHWLQKNYFRADKDSHREPYTIAIPPPNVTGKLTIGHVLNNSIQDILIRKARMEGKNACWVPGTDHASIATEQKVVEMLNKQGIKKDSLTREEFLEYAWDWRKEYGGIIIDQLKKLGCSCDWERERFTMDDDYSRSVMEAFVRLYNQGKIYRGKRLVNWCPASKSAISDEEVLHREVQGKLWYLQYPLAESNEYVIVATTRPETMLGDTAVAVNPNDQRYKKLIGKKIQLPLNNRQIFIIADKFVDPEFGTGCVKVTPAHDPNDFALSQRHDLNLINIMNEDASMNDNVPETYRGLSREDARKKIIVDMEALGLLRKIEDYVHNVGYSERGQVPIESYLSEQWFLKMDELAAPALEAVNSGLINFHPQHWVKTYNHWMENIRDWCISRQLWWGHQIPVWYNRQDAAKIHVSVDGPDDPQNWIRDPDVLDTWASSWLWPFAIHGWPQEKTELNTFYPTDALVTGPDIIFFWVARMIMSGLEFRGTIPFKHVYFNSILRDEKGQKFSKSLGNSPDPIELFQEFGTDAVRFGIMLIAPQGLDVLFSKSRLEVSRNFMNKLWNASRFVDMNLNQGDIPDWEPEKLHLELSDHWIISRLNQTAREVNKQLDRFHFNEAAKAIYDFTWSDFCDWYIEIAKIRFNGEQKDSIQTAQAVSVHVLKGILRLLHPYAPFVTEELWNNFRGKDDADLIISPWLKGDNELINSEKETSFNVLKDIISAVRTVRSGLNIPSGKKADLIIRNANDHHSLIESYSSIICSLAKVKTLQAGQDQQKPDHSATAIVQNMELFIPLEGLIDLDQEQIRLNKRLHELKNHLNGVNIKLENKDFLKRAPEKVINNERKKLKDMTVEFELIKSNLEMIQ